MQIRISSYENQYNNFSRHIHVLHSCELFYISGMTEKEACDFDPMLSKVCATIKRYVRKGLLSYFAEEENVEYLYNTPCATV